MYDPMPTQSNQGHRLVVSWFEPHRRARRNIQPHSESNSTIETERLVNLEEMKVRAYLDWPIANIDYIERARLTPLISHDVALTQYVLARDHLPALPRRLLARRNYRIG
jgi:hypothetical protein